MGIFNAATGILGKIPSPITQGLSVAGQIFGYVKGAKANKDQQNQLNKNVEANEADYNNSANKSFLDTNVARNQVKKLDANLVDQQKNVAGRSVITGASDEANLAANNNVQQNYNDAISNVAANATDYQMDQKRMYQYQKNRLDARQDQINQQKAESAGNLIGNASDLFKTVSYKSGMNPGGENAPFTGVNARTQEQTDGLNKIKDSAPNFGTSIKL